jgi:hypothetical protein
MKDVFETAALFTSFAAAMGVVAGAAAACMSLLALG